MNIFYKFEPMLLRTVILGAQVSKQDLGKINQDRDRYTLFMLVPECRHGSGICRHLHQHCGVLRAEDVIQAIPAEVRDELDASTANLRR